MSVNTSYFGLSGLERRAIEEGGKIKALLSQYQNHFEKLRDSRLEVFRRDDKERALYFEARVDEIKSSDFDVVVRVNPVFCKAHRPFFLTEEKGKLPITEISLALSYSFSLLDWNVNPSNGVVNVKWFYWEFVFTPVMPRLVSANNEGESILRAS